MVDAGQLSSIVTGIGMLMVVLLIAYHYVDAASAITGRRRAD
jgi:hypothetical protein